MSGETEFHTTNILAALLKRSALCRCVSEWCHLEYQRSEMSSESSNNRATRDWRLAYRISTPRQELGQGVEGAGEGCVCVGGGGGGGYAAG